MYIPKNSEEKKYANYRKIYFSIQISYFLLFTYFCNVTVSNTVDNFPLSNTVKDWAYFDWKILKMQFIKKKICKVVYFGEWAGLIYFTVKKQWKNWKHSTIILILHTTFFKKLNS